MVLADKMDEFGKPAWIAATVFGFWLFWPVGVAMLGFLAWSGRFRAWRSDRAGKWHNMNGQNMNQTRGGCGWGMRSAHAPSGNRAFDEYRAETLRRLEDEQKEFVEYLERLRQAKDKAEFDQFMDERRRPPATTN